MLALLYASLLLSPAASAPAQQGLERWLSAVERHEPGKADEAATEIAQLTNGNLLAAIGAIRRATIANTVLRRGAVLHLDVALHLEGKATGPLFPTAADGPQAFTVLDGRPLGLASTTIRPHLDFARALLDLIKPDPKGDVVVRFWHVATTLALARRYELAEAAIQLREGRRLFPGDPDLYVAQGCLYEVYASRRFQAIARTTAARGRAVAVGSERQNLIAAEKMFREALAINPDYGEARLRLGRTLSLQGRHKEAVKELQQVAARKLDRIGSYFSLLFLAREEEVLGRPESARGYYERAGTLYPKAQTPHLALSRLAFHDGDTPRAERAVAQVMALPEDEQERFDPWWIYLDGLGRFAEPVLERLYRAVTVGPR